MRIYRDVHPADLDRLTSLELRERFRIPSVFQPGRQNLYYWDVDRAVIGGVVPTETTIPLETPPGLAAGSFCERRELGIINLGGAGCVQVGDVSHDLAQQDGLYLGRGSATPPLGSVVASICAGAGYSAQWSLRPRSILYCSYIASFSSTSSDVNGDITYIALLSSTIVERCRSAPSDTRRSISSFVHVRGR